MGYVTEGVGNAEPATRTRGGCWCRVQQMSSTKSPAVPENSSKPMVFSTLRTLKWSVLDCCCGRQQRIKGLLLESCGRLCIPMSKNLLAPIHVRLGLSRNNLA